jgi:hypothetical protein
MAAPGVWISVYSYGPTPSTAVMLTVSGFQQPTTVPTGTCELDGLVVRCYLGDLGVTAKSNPPECGTGPVGRFFTCYSFTLTLSSPITPPPLTFAVSGPLPDPDNSNNSRTMFGSAAAPPAPNPGGGGGGSSADRPLFGPVPVSSGSPQPTPSVDLTTEASQSGSEVAGRETDPYRPGLAVTVGVAGFMVGACVGGAGLVLAWRRLFPRPVGPPDSDPGDSGDLTGHPLPAAPPVSGVL